MELVKYNGNLKSELFRFTTECFAELGKSMADTVFIMK